MIVTVTLNAALDVTYEVEALVPHGSHRVTKVIHKRAGGKGVNVSRVLAALGVPTVVTGLAGGATGQLIRDDLRMAGLRDELVPMIGESRRTMTVVSRRDGDATVFNEAGPVADAAAWDGFTARFGPLVRDARVVVLSGSLPLGLPSDAYAELIHTATEAGATTILDSSGPALLDGLSGGPSLAKPNATEILDATGHKDILRAAAALRAQGARSVVASLGPDGLLAVTPAGCWRAVPPQRLTGNPTGAGDACVAALAAGLSVGQPWPDLLRDAVALSAAAVPRPLAGDYDADLYQHFRTTAHVEEHHASHHH
ncbi:1-phosphofructokinase family hexose kinase [Streptomyces halobius]|uniref:1-phosphofructokinase family hexose kinase n=1 Tax=Streptomyces halobius TaxID=2879846 RepID=A0ABY4M5F1_9ACTN|nr:1-phosphofructokinase family hexose kinase [Streptomyces halobius]UQA92054.1 1-phosphofructokinase family hexose kinase [Streptomyces halobius]